MKVCCLCLFFILTFEYILTQRPKDIRIFKVKQKQEKQFYEYTVFKKEIFSFGFKRERGTPYYWDHLNDSFSDKTKIIKFLNSIIIIWVMK